jgi:hypothetical protein
MTAANNAMFPLPSGATSAVVSSIRQAARATNVDFGLLMAQAQQESGFRPDAKASGSSATGLYQFIDSTWLSLVQRFGAKYGAGAFAQQITTDAAGHATVADAATRRRILDLRTDPALSASLAAEYVKLNKGELEQALGRSAGTAELYMAHVLGASGATTFLKALEGNGATPAAKLLPEAAAANRSVFYDAGGGARTVSEIYHAYSARIEHEARQFAAVASGAPTSAPPLGASGFLQSLGFAGKELTAPLAAMLDVFAASTLRLLSNATPSAGLGAGRRVL